MSAATRESKQRIVAATGVCLLAVALGPVGCATYTGGGTQPTPAANQGPAASPVQHPMLTGIPLPIGFCMVPERSVARESGRFRVAQFEFEGPTSPEAVTRFYTDYMPTAKFTLRQKRFDSGQYDLRFDSDTEECNVRVRRGHANTVLVVDIGPLPKGSTEREAQPPARQR